MPPRGGKTLVDKFLSATKRLTRWQHNMPEICPPRGSKRRFKRSMERHNQACINTFSNIGIAFSGMSNGTELITRAIIEALNTAKSFDQQNLKMMVFSSAEEAKQASALRLQPLTIEAHKHFEIPNFKLKKHGHKRRKYYNEQV